MLDFSQYEDKKASIFNDGNAGLVSATRLEIRDVAPVAGKNMPSFNLIHIDSQGRELRGQSVWELTGNEDAETMKRIVQNLGGIWKACMEGKPFQSNPTIRAFWDAIANSGQTFDVFVTYGTTEKPSRYMSTRRYDFIRATGSSKILAVKPTDVMVRPAADSEVASVSEGNGADDLPFN